MKGTYTIRAKIATLFTVVITVLLLLSNSAVYFAVNKIMQKKVLEDLMQTSSQCKLNIDSMINSIDQFTILLFTDRIIVEAINRSEYTSSEINIAVNKVNQQLERSPLSPVIPSSTVSLFINDEFQLASKISSSELLYNGLYNDALVNQEAWYEKTLEKDGKMHFFSLSMNGRDLFCIARLVKNSVNTIDSQEEYNKNVGVVVVSMDIAMLGDLLENSKLTKGNKVLFTNDFTDIIYATGTKEENGRISKQSNSRDQALTNYVKKLSETGLYTVKVNKKAYYTYLIDIKSGCRLISMVPLTDIVDSIAIINKITVVAVSVAVIMGAALTILISGSILKPIKRLADIMGDINSTKNIKAIVKPSKRDEVGVLYESFNKMMDRINKLIADVYSSENSRREAELKALEYQINPHFIYNTMDSVNLLALEAGMDDIANIISDLSDIMRYSIKGISGLVTIEEELEQLKKYVNIQIVCYGGFDVIYQISENILKYHIPKLILQPLVENSIVHGITKIAAGGRIYVSGQISGDCINLCISDNGSENNMEKIKQLLNCKNGFPNTGEYGIKNVDQRIKLHFGNIYGLSYIRNEKGEIIAVVKIPFQ